MMKALNGALILIIAVSSFSGGTVKVQTPPNSNGALLAKLEVPGHYFNSVSFSPDGKLLAACYIMHGKGGITIWNLADHRIVETLPEGNEVDSGINQVAFSPDGKLLAAGTEHGEVLLWTIGSRQSYKTILTGFGSAKDISFSPNNAWLGYAGEKQAGLFELSSGKATTIATAGARAKEFLGVSFSPDNKFAIVCGFSFIHLWDIANGKMAKEWKPDGFSFFGRLSPDGQHVIAGGGPVFREKLVQIWNFPEGTEIKRLTDFRAGLFTLAISHSGKLFAVGGGTYGNEGGHLSLWDLDDGKELGFDSFGEVPSRGLEFSPDDRILAAATGADSIRLYDVDRFRGPKSKKQDAPQCGEIVVEGNKTFILPLVEVPVPMRDKFEYPWRLEILNPDSAVGLTGKPVVLQDWSLEKGADDNRARIHAVKSLLPDKSSSMKTLDHITFAYTQNPGWNEGFAVKIYEDGTFVTASTTGQCRAYGNLNQFQTDFQTVKKRLISEGLLAVPRDPLVLGSDHYGVAFIELVANGTTEVRSDADSIEILLNKLPAKKREAFSRIFKLEEKFVDSLINAGMNIPK